MTKIFDKELQEKLLKELSNLDIPKHAGDVYLALFILGEAGISSIERETGLHRQVIYNNIKILEDLGLIKHAIFNGKKRFSSQPPRRILSLVDKKRRTAESLVLELTNINQTFSQEFEIYQGDNAFVEHQFQTLYDAKEGETLELIGSQWESFYKVMGQKKMDEYEKLRKGRGISIRYIGSEEQNDTLAKSVSGRPLFSYRILPGLSNGLVNTSIWDKSVIFNLFGNPVIAFVVQDESVAKSQREFFETLWNLGKVPQTTSVEHGNRRS